MSDELCAVEGIEGGALAHGAHGAFSSRVNHLLHDFALALIGRLKLGEDGLRNGFERGGDVAPIFGIGFEAKMEDGAVV